MRLRVDGRAWLRMFAVAEVMVVGVPVAGFLAVFFGTAALWTPGLGLLFMPFWMVLWFVVGGYFLLPALVVPGLVECTSPMPALLPSGVFGWVFVIAFCTALAAAFALVASLYTKANRGRTEPGLSRATSPPSRAG